MKPTGVWHALMSVLTPATAPAHIDPVALARTLPPRLLKFFKHNPPHVDGEAPPNAPLNPFRPHKHPKTGRWHPPIYSLRQQADLTKLARAHGVEPLLPPSVKSSAYREQRQIEHGLRVKGTGVGQRVKGRMWERELYAKLDKRRSAMLRMPKLIIAWKRTGHGRGWKRWPSGKKAHTGETRR